LALVGPSGEISIRSTYPDESYLNYMVESLCFSTDGTQIITADRSGQVCFWDLAQRALAKSQKFAADNNSLQKRERRSFLFLPSPTLLTRLSPHAKFLVREVFADRLLLFEVATGGRMELSLGQHWKKLEQIVDTFSPDDSLLLLQLLPVHDLALRPLDEYEFQLWETKTGHLKWNKFIKTANTQAKTYFLPDGKSLVIDNQSIDIATGAQGGEFLAIGDERRFHLPNQRSYLSASIERSGSSKANAVIRWCEGPSGQERILLGQPQADVLLLHQMSADGRWLAAFDPRAGRILVWNLLNLPQSHPAALSDPDWQSTWAELNDVKAADAWRAMYRMLEQKDDSVRFLRTCFRRFDPKQVNQWLEQLGDRKFAIRESATEKLQALGPVVEMELQAARKSESAEIRRRAEYLLIRLPPPGTPIEQVRARRAVEVLELINSEASKQLLQEWSTSAVYPEVRTEAQRALENLDRKRTGAALRPNR
jgi:hypothetical protein